LVFFLVGFLFCKLIGCETHIEKQYKAKKAVNERARQTAMMNDVCFGTETTGFTEEAETNRAAIVDADGSVLFNSLVKCEAK